MKKMNWLTKTLAIGGTILVTIPMLAPIIFSIIHLISTGRFLLDFLMPAELGIVVFIGSGLLLWAAIRSRLCLKWIAWSTGIAIVLVFGSQGLAGITGLASGRSEPVGWQFGVVLGGIIGYDLAVIALSIGGVLLCRHLLRRGNE
ncbi:MAG TPA: hypothetical protein DIW44_08080 [Anaerolineaceae bacterium]|nr:hypothetical protein [Anaerolineaceae bacterium]